MAHTQAEDIAMILARMDGLAARAEEDRSDRHAYEEDARSHREETNRQLQHLTHGQELTNARLAKIEPVTSSLRDFKKSVITGALVLSFVGSAALTAIYAFGDLIGLFTKGH